MKWFQVLFCFVSLQSYAQCEFTEVSIQTSTAQWGDEMSWELFHALDGSEPLLIASFQGDSDWTTSDQVLCLEDGCYFFSVADSWGDGWNGGAISSSLPLEGFPDTFTLDDGYAGYLAFEVGEVACDTNLPGCTEPDALNYVQGANVDDGSCVFFETF